MKMEDLGAVTDSVTILVSEGKNPQTLSMPIDVDDPAVQQLMALQRETPIPLSVLFSPRPIDRANPLSPLLGSQFGVVYRNRHIWVKDVQLHVADKNLAEEIGLRVKEFVLLRERRLDQLRDNVRALERMSEGPESRRTPIPQAVKIAVFERDKGQCVQCGARDRLQFDHVIPVVKGGGSSEANVQILCQRCNLEKSSRIL